MMNEDPTPDLVATQAAALEQLSHNAELFQQAAEDLRRAAEQMLEAVKRPSPGIVEF